MVTVVTRPTSYAVEEVPIAKSTPPTDGPVQVGYDDTAGVRRRFTLFWERSLNSLGVYRHIFSPAYAGPIGALFDWTPPREGAPVRARRVTPIQNITVRNARSVSFQVTLEQFKTS